MLALTYRMDQDFVGMPPWQRSHFLVLVALGQPEHFLLAQAEQVGSQVVAVKEVHHTVSGNHGEADSEETIVQVYLCQVTITYLKSWSLMSFSPCLWQKST